MKKKNWLTAEFRMKGEDEDAWRFEKAFPLDGTAEEVKKMVEECFDYVEYGNTHGYSDIEYRVGHRFF